MITSTLGLPGHSSGRRGLDRNPTPLYPLLTEETGTGLTETRVFKWAPRLLSDLDPPDESLFCYRTLTDGAMTALHSSSSRHLLLGGNIGAGSTKLGEFLAMWGSNRRPLELCITHNRHLARRTCRSGLHHESRIKSSRTGGVPRGLLKCPVTDRRSTEAEACKQT